MNRAAIKSIVDSEAWPEVVDFIYSLFSAELDTKGMSVEEIGRHYLALQLARERFNAAVVRLRSIADQEQRETVSYK